MLTQSELQFYCFFLFEITFPIFPNIYRFPEYCPVLVGLFRGSKKPRIMKWVNMRSDLANVLDQCYMLSKWFAFSFHEFKIKFLQHDVTKFASSFRETNITIQLPSDDFDVGLSLEVTGKCICFVVWT